MIFDNNPPHNCSVCDERIEGKHLEWILPRLRLYMHLNCADRMTKGVHGSILRQRNLAAMEEQTHFNEQLPLEPHPF